MIRKKANSIFTTSLLILSCVVLSCRSSERFSASEQMNSAKTLNGPIKYVALGDSTGVGVGARDGGYVIRMFRKLEQRRPGSSLKNFCVSGATSEDLLRDQVDAGVAGRPDLVTIGIGINDIGHGFSVDRFGENFQNLLSRVKTETGALIVVTNIPDISTSTRIPQFLRQQYQQQIVQFNRKLREISDANGAVVFDIYSITEDELPKHPEYFSDDGFHPSDEGYALWAEKMWPTLARTVGVAE